jgi:hypothetical protein
VQCSGGSVTLLKTVLDGGSRGLDASGGCTEVNVQQTKVTNATGAGLYIAGSTKYTIINTGVFKTAIGGGEGDAINTDDHQLLASLPSTRLHEWQ